MSLIATANYRSVMRYAVGSTLILGISSAYSFPLSYILPVLSLGFFAPGKKAPKFIEGVFFVTVVFLSTFIGNILAGQASKPFFLVVLLMIVLLNVFYTNNKWITPLLKTWILVSVLLLPMMNLLFPELSSDVSQALVRGALLSIIMVWLVYGLFPAMENQLMKSQQAITEQLSQTQRLRKAILSTLVILPVFILFYAFKISGAILVLIFIGILSMEPSFAKNFQKGKALLIGNLIGGVVSVIIYNLLIVVPEITFLVLIMLVAGLILGNMFFSGSKMAPLYNMAFSTTLLIIGSVSAPNSEEQASSAVFTRILQIMAAVTYVVFIFGMIEKWSTPKPDNSSNDKILPS